MGDLDMVRENTGIDGGMRNPTFIIAGAMRCATSTLHSHLREHPEVAVATTKEVHFFDERFDLGMGWYRQQFPNAEHAVAVGEATPNYLYSPEAIGRIAGTLPDVRLIVTSVYKVRCWPNDV